MGHHGGGPALRYGTSEQARILQEFARPPDREKDGTATWSLTTLQRALRRAPDGLPTVSTYVIFQTLHQAGYTWQKDRTWCDTGIVERKRKEGIVTVTDPHALEKRGRLSRRTQKPKPRAFLCGTKTKRGRIKPFRNPEPVGNRKASPLASRMSTFGREPPSCLRCFIPTVDRYAPCLSSKRPMRSCIPGSSRN